MIENSLILRPATLADLPVLFEFEKGIVFTERPFDSTLREGEIHYYDLQWLIESPDAALLVIETGGRLVASGYARIETAKAYLKHQYYAYLGFMYVLPEFRGRQLVKQIIDGLAAWAAERNIHELRLDVYAQNAGAVRAYEKLGFEKLLVEMRMNTTDKR